MLIPLFLFYVGVLIKDSNLGFLLIGSFGIIGFFFRNIAFKIVEKIYKSEKYETVKAYKIIDKWLKLTTFQKVMTKMLF